MDALKNIGDWGERIHNRCASGDPTRMFKPTLEPDSLEQMAINNLYVGGAAAVGGLLLGSPVSSTLNNAVAGAIVYDGIVVYKLYQQGLLKSFWNIGTNTVADSPTGMLLCQTEQALEKLPWLEWEKGVTKKIFDWTPGGNWEFSTGGISYGGGSTVKITPEQAKKGLDQMWETINKKKTS